MAREVWAGFRPDKINELIRRRLENEKEEETDGED